jgi:adenine-specific DNA-methyltransferase
LENPTGLRLLEKIRAAGKPLREFVGERIYRGITTGFNDAFVVDQATHDQLIKEHKSSKEILKPYLRGKDVERWRLAPQDQWLIFTRRGIDIKKFPAVHEYLKQFKKQLTPGTDGGRKPGSYEWYEIQDNIAYWKKFETTKIISTKISIRPTFAFDTTNCYLGNTAYFLPVETGALYLIALLNSNLFFCYAKRIFVEKQGGWYEVQPDGLESFPIPAATPEQQRWCERLTEAIIWLNSPEQVRKSGGSAPTSLMAAYFEQWLNGLVYELFFADELHARNLRIFDETAKLEPPALAELSDAQKLTNLNALFEKAYDIKAPLRAMLFSLPSVESVRIIEGEPQTPA